MPISNTVTIDCFAEFPVWDAAELIRLMGDNPPVHRRLLEKFLLKAQEQVDTILRAAAAGDAAMIGRVAHVLKSSANTVGAMRLGELCLRLEKAGKAGDVPVCQMLAENLNESFSATAEKIRRSLN